MKISHNFLAAYRFSCLFENNESIQLCPAQKTWASTDYKEEICVGTNVTVVLT
jgi:hypothetical protein